MTFKNSATYFTTLNNLDDEDLQTKYGDNIFVFQNVKITKLWQDNHSVSALLQGMHLTDNLNIQNNHLSLPISSTFFLFYNFYNP